MTRLRLIAVAYVAVVVGMAAATLHGKQAPVPTSVELTGSWQMVNDEERLVRIDPGPELGNFTGFPLNAAGKQKALAWNSTIQAVPEHQARPHGATYSMRGPGPNFHMGEIIDPVTRQLTYSTAGHNPPRLLHGQSVLSLRDGGDGEAWMPHVLTDVGLDGGEPRRAQAAFLGQFGHVPPRPDRQRDEVEQHGLDAGVKSRAARSGLIVQKKFGIMKKVSRRRGLSPHRAECIFRIGNQAGDSIAGQR